MSLRRLLVHVLLLTGSVSASLAAPPDIILITLDTTRADKMGFLGCQRGLTPHLDGLARQSIIFSRAYAHVPLTTPSHATILTGTYPQFNHVGDLGRPLAKGLPYLPDILHRHGYQTAAFVGSQVLDPKGVGAPGFDFGFDVYDAGFHSRRSGEDRYHSIERRAGTVVDHALTWLRHNAREPFFLWVHLYDPHDPYDPPAPFRARYANAPYDGEIAYTDVAVGRLLVALRADGFYDRAIIAVMADHGEAFGEHGERGHGFFLYDETIHVPLLIKFPAQRFSGLRVESRVGLVDVAPTILQTVGIKIPSIVQGVSLLNMVRPKGDRRGSSGRQVTEAAPEHPAYAETDYPHRAFGYSSLRAWRAGKYLYVQAPKRELYDQSIDPEASHNLAVNTKAVVDTMAQQLEDFRLHTSSAAMRPAELTAGRAEQLQALGYAMTGLSKADAKENERETDPKDKVEIANLLHEALLDMEDEHYNDAIPRLELVLQAQPTLGLANMELGRAWSALQNHQKALPLLEKAVQLIPESGRAHYEFGVALAETGDWASARLQFEAAVAHVLDSEDLHFYLAMADEQTGRTADAIQQFQATLQLDPNHFRANLLLGRLLGMENKPVAALPYLRKAVLLQPQAPDPHKFLANVYTELGQDENARHEQAEAERLKSLVRP